jgi:hypothetical protein
METPQNFTQTSNQNIGFALNGNYLDNIYIQLLTMGKKDDTGKVRLDKSLA